MHPTLNTMLATDKIADLHREAAQARLVHELRERQATTRRMGWTARVASYLTLTATRTPTRLNA